MPEEKISSQFDFLRSKPAIAVTAVLLAEIILFYTVPTKEYIPSPPPLDQFSNTVGPWRTFAQFPIDDETRDLLRADDTLTREYVGPSQVELFVAFFKTQRAGVSPHSPKICLPGNGWTENSSGIISVSVPGEPSPIPVNRYIVSLNDQRELVLYWYQNPHRVTANEYLSKFYLIFDSLRYRRSDEALVRVIARVDGNDGDARAEEQAIRFVQALYQPLKRQMWSGPSSAAVQPFSADRRP
jgi:EpsI family protein